MQSVKSSSANRVALGDLFPAGSEPYSRPKPVSMSSYEFYARSDRPEMAEMRNCWNDIYRRCRLPKKSKSDILNRFRSRDDSHYSALFELFLYEFMHLLGWKAGIPSALKSGRPDFLVSVPGSRNFYLEATCLLGSLKLTAQERLHSKIYQTIREIESNEFRVALSIRGNPEVEIGSMDLRLRVEKWLKGLDYNRLLSILRAKRDITQLPAEVIAHGSLQIVLTPIPQSPPSSSKENGLVLLGPTSVTRSRVSTQMRQKLMDKAKQCASSRLPVVVALNVLRDTFDTDAILDALFGELVVDVSFKDGHPVNWKSERGKLGLWCHLGRCQNSTISAVILFSHLDHFLFPSRKPQIVLNPFTVHKPIPLNLPFFDYFIPSRDGLSLRPI